MSSKYESKGDKLQAKHEEGELFFNDLAELCKKHDAFLSIYRDGRETGLTLFKNNELIAKCLYVTVEGPVGFKVYDAPVFDSNSLIEAFNAGSYSSEDVDALSKDVDEEDSGYFGDWRDAYLK